MSLQDVLMSAYASWRECSFQLAQANQRTTFAQLSHRITPIFPQPCTGFLAYK